MDSKPEVKRGKAVAIKIVAVLVLGVFLGWALVPDKIASALPDFLVPGGTAALEPPKSGVIRVISGTELQQLLPGATVKWKLSEGLFGAPNGRHYGTDGKWQHSGPARPRRWRYRIDGDRVCFDHRAGSAVEGSCIIFYLSDEGRYFTQVVAAPNAADKLTLPSRLGEVTIRHHGRE